MELSNTYNVARDGSGVVAIFDPAFPKMVDHSEVVARRYAMLTNLVYFVLVLIIFIVGFKGIISTLSTFVILGIITACGFAVNHYRDQVVDLIAPQDDAQHEVRMNSIDRSARRELLTIVDNADQIHASGIVSHSGLSRVVWQAAQYAQEASSFDTSSTVFDSKISTRSTPDIEPSREAYEKLLGIDQTMRVLLDIANTCKSLSSYVEVDAYDASDTVAQFSNEVSRARRRTPDLSDLLDEAYGRLQGLAEVYDRTHNNGRAPDN